MNIENLIVQITDSIQQRLGSKCNVSTTKVTKNNGIVLNGLVFQEEGTHICPTIYIDDFLEGLALGVPVKTVIQKILELYQKSDIQENIDVSNLAEFQNVKSRIIFQLINTERNASLLSEIPSIPFLDFSIIFKILIGSSAENTATGTIGYSLMKIWNVSVEELHEAAKVNTPVLMPCELKSMREILEGYNDIPFIDDCCKMFVLSNQQRVNGCGCILYPYVLEKFAENICSDLFILPSSVHDVILVPFNEVSKRQDAEALAEIVRSVNERELSQEDFLSDHVYHYSRKTKSITIAK